MRDRRVRDATSKERHVCARRRDGEPAGSPKTGGLFAGIRGGFYRAENGADGPASLAAIEGAMSQGLLAPERPFRHCELIFDERLNDLELCGRCRFKSQY